MVRYLIDNGMKSVISRNYGVFKIKCKGMQSIYVILMQNNKRPNLHLDNVDPPISTPFLN